LDYVDSAPAIVERYRPPPVIARTLVYDDLKMLDDFARESTAGMLARRWTTSAKSYEAYSTKSSEVSEGEEELYCGAGG